jgi:hypothetical protein
MSTQVLTQQIADFFKNQPVLKVWLFGSFSRGEERDDSDIDLVTEGNLAPFAHDSFNRDKILIYERAA